MKRSYLAMAIVAVCCARAYAQQDTEESIVLAPVMVTASREDRALQELASNARVIGREQLLLQQGQTLADALRLEPGVSMDGSGRFGLNDVTIRGVSGNRVKITYDGMPVADRFAFGPFQDSGRAYFDLDNAAQVEIIRGPVSSLQGASALGGVVSIVTESPDSMLAPGVAFGGTLDTAYTGKDSSKNIGGSIAFRSGDAFSGLLDYHYTNSHELNNYGGWDIIGAQRGVPDPQDNNKHNLNGKLVYDFNADHRFTVSASYYKDRRETDLLGTLGVSPAPVPGKFYDTFSNRADDRQSRKAISLTHDFVLPTPLSDSGYWHAYVQNQESAQVTNRYRKSPFIPAMHGLSEKQHERKAAYFSTSDAGFDVQLEKEIVAPVSQEWIYGLSYIHRDVTMKRHNTTVNDNGMVTENKIEKNAPDTTVNEFGAFVQNRLDFGDSGFTLIPGVRYDYYGLVPHEDEVYRQTVGQRYKVRHYNENRLSARLGALYELNDSNTLYANYSEGFRAPSFSETNLGFVNERQGYALVENPGLKPETSRGIELGWRMDNGIWSHTLSGFYTRYNNFILTQSVKGFNPQSKLMEFQNINLPSAEIYGAEWSSGFDIGRGLGIGEGLNLQTALAYAKGEDRSTGQPVAGIEPLGGVVSLRYDAPREQWGAAATLTAASGKKVADIPADARQDPRSALQPTGGYGVVDLTGYYQPFPDLTVRVGLYNAFDKKYIPWSTAKLAGLDHGLNTAPGRWFGASLRYEF